MDKINREHQLFSTVPFSIPTLIPGSEDFRMNGFSFSDDFGIIVSFRRDDDPTLDPLNSFRGGFATNKPNSGRNNGQNRQTPGIGGIIPSNSGRSDGSDGDR